MKINVKKPEREFLIKYLEYASKYLLIEIGERASIDSILYKLGVDNYNREKADILNPTETINL